MKEPEADDSTILKIKTDALRLLSFRPRSVAELRQRLKMKRYPAAAIDGVIETLTRQGLLDDEKFATLFTESRLYTKPSGRRQIELDLKRKGVSNELISAALGELKDYDEKAAACELVTRRFEKMSGLSDEKKKTRVFGFLKRRGFDNEVIFGVIADLFKADDNG